MFPTCLPSLPPPSDHPCANPAWRIYISPNKTEPSPTTRHKTTERAPYDEARALIPKAMPLRFPTDIISEILIVNTNDEIMEGSICTPYFRRNNTWVTPPTSAGGNIGTTRRLALRMGLCSEAKVPRASVQVGETLWLSNGVRGFGWGRIVQLDRS